MAKYKIIPSSRTIVQSPISIGHKAEKGVEAIEFDLTAWVETYGSGTLTVIMRRWGDAIPYPIALEIDENNKATWTLSDIDTAKAGIAYAQLNYIVGDEVVKKSDIYTFRVMDSLTGEGEPPEAYESWLEHLTHLAAEAMAEVLDIEGIVTDKTLTVDGGIADGKATGDALALKADKSTTYTKTEVDHMIEDVEVKTDTTLEVAGAPADAAETGRQFGLIKADLDAISNLYSYSTIIPDWTWELGTYTSDGVLTPNDKRVRSGKHMLSAPLTLHVEDGYRYYVHYYASESATAHDTTRQDGGVSGWITTSYTIDVNAWFAISIAKTAESGDYTASTDWGNYVYSIIENVLVNTVLSSKALAESNELRLDEVESALANNDLPEYWITYLDGKKDSIVNILADIGNHGDVFSYFTDYHAPLNAGHTAEILKYINNSVDMRKNIFGGDILTNHTKSQALTILNAFASDFKDLNLLSTNGNHEYNRYSGDTADRLTDAEWYAFLLGDNELDRRISFMSPNGYYYVDNAVQKIRYLFLNTNYSFTQFSIDTAQIRWIISTLNSVKDGWGVVIFTHWYYGTVNADYTLTRDGIGDAIKAICDGYATKTTGTVLGIEAQYNVDFDFTNADGEMICVICGHTHNDYAEQAQSGYWVIATMCDAYHGSQQNPAITRTLGTVSEQAIDLYFIDRADRKISTIRIGAGSDRTFSY